MLKKPLWTSFRPIRLWMAVALVTVVLDVAVFMLPALAGPPFVTDDPEPVEFQHWEFYVAHQYSHDEDAVFATAPHLEVNYGVIPNMQLHLLVPLAYNKPHEGPTTYGFGDLELGIKYRFVQEGDYMPMVWTFPILHLPTGNSKRGLGSGEVQFFLPVWLQKSWGPWQSYGGGGYWINPASDNQNYWYAGWQAQREVTKVLTLGGELFYTTPRPGTESISSIRMWAASSILRRTTTCYSPPARTYTARISFQLCGLPVYLEACREKTQKTGVRDGAKVK